MSTTKASYFTSSNQACEEHFNPDVSSPHCMEEEIESVLNSTTTITSFEVTSIFLSVQNYIIQFASQGENASLNNYEEQLAKVFAWLSKINSDLLVAFEEQIYIAVAFVNLIRRKKANGGLVNQIFKEKGLNLSFEHDELSQNISSTLKKLWIERNSTKLRISNSLVAQVATILTELIMYTNDRTALELLHPLFELFCKQVNVGFWPEHRDSICRYLSQNSLNLMGHFSFYSLKKESSKNIDNYCRK